MASSVVNCYSTWTHEVCRTMWGKARTGIKLVRYCFLHGTNFLCTGSIYCCLYCLYFYQYHNTTINIIDTITCINTHTTCTNTISYIVNDIQAIIIVYAMNISYYHTNITLVEANPTA